MRILTYFHINNNDYHCQPICTIKMSHLTNVQTVGYRHRNNDLALYVLPNIHKETAIQFDDLLFAE